MAKKNTELVEVAPAVIVPAEPAAENLALEVTRSMDIVKTTMDHFMSSANVDAVFGEVVQNGDTLIIPTAEIVSAMGFGIGLGVGNNPGSEGTGQPGGSGGGGGGGGGGRVFSRPVAVVIANPQGVYVQPVWDLTKVTLAALTAGGFVLGMLLRMFRGRISDGE